jgi:hypothetical protein
MYKESKAD